MKNFIITILCSFFIVNISSGQLFTNFNNSFPPASNAHVGIGTPPAVDFHVIGNEVRFEENNFLTGLNNAITSSNFCAAIGGDNNIESSEKSAGIGGHHFIYASGESVSIGEGNEIFSGHGSVAIGGHNHIKGGYTFALGRELQSVGDNIITMGSSVGNYTNNSFMVGYNTPNLFVDGNTGRTGINTITPQQELDVDGIIRATSLLGGGNVCATPNGELFISGACGSGPGDNLGDHNATMGLNMNCFDIYHVANIEFCNGTYLNQMAPGELVLQFGSFGIGMNPSSAPFGPHQLAVNGSIFGTGLFITSDKKFKKNIQRLPNSLDNVMKIKGYNYEYDSNNKDFKFEIGKTNGFIAQELQEVYPELVRDEGEFLSVNYVGLIPVLTEAIKEQQAIIESNTVETAELRKEIEELKSMVNSICTNGCGEIGMIQSDNSSQSGGADQMRLLQNSPNPFNSITSISFYLPSESKNAALSIYDLQGKLIESFDISERGNGKIEINAGDLPSGMYYYGLLVDGKASPTLKMILTN